MSELDWIACIALGVASVATFARSYLQSARLPFAPNAPLAECLAYDLLAGAAGLRAWVIYEGLLHATMSEALLAVTVAVTACFGLSKVVIYARR